ncbi:Cysteine protease atg4b [Cichlidogyrus casuarinus]|uniref:Cysteine protease n=1 Tax=Cichlidogyrus casuarinus TaxID=1844966 RepID=A0ABD2QC05_9PLAT
MVSTSPRNIVRTILPASSEGAASLDDEMELIDMPADEKNFLRKPYDPEVLPFTNSTLWHPMLLIVPLRLGIQDINPTYFESLKAVFQIPQSVGILGGRPNKAHWSIGVMDDSLISLDPHFTQPAAIFTSNIPKESEDQTFHCRRPISTRIADLDPSLALGFYCADENSFLDLCRRLKNQVISKDSDTIVEVHDTLSCDFDAIDCDIDLDEDEFADSPDGEAHDCDAVLIEPSVFNPINDPAESFDLLN